MKFRIIVYLLLAAGLLYAVETWSPGSRELAEARARAAHALGQGDAWRARMAALADMQAAALAAARVAGERSARARAARQVAEDSVAVTRAVAAGELAVVLPSLRLRFAGPDRYETDSVGVRHLAGLWSEALEARLVLPPLREEAAALRDERDQLRLAVRTGQAQIRLAADRVDSLTLAVEDLLDATRGQGFRRAASVVCVVGAGVAGYGLADGRELAILGGVGACLLTQGLSRLGRWLF